MWVRATLDHSQFVRNKGDIEMAAASLTYHRNILNEEFRGSIIQFIPLLCI